MLDEKAMLSHFSNYDIPSEFSTNLLSNIYSLTNQFGTSVFQNDQITKGVKRLHCEVPSLGKAITTIIAASRDDSINHSLAIIVDDQFTGDGFASQYIDANGTHKLYIDTKITANSLSELIVNIKSLAESKGVLNEEEADLHTYKPNLSIEQYFNIQGACIPVLKQSDETLDQLRLRADLTLQSFDHPDELMLYDFGKHSPIGDGLGIIKRSDLQFVAARQEAAIEVMQELGLEFNQLNNADPDTLKKLKQMVEEKLANG
ncbi:hypothetical protein N9045_00705 [bacterium]|nr:hypothetical protein [bacterium]